MGNKIIEDAKKHFEETLSFLRKELAGLQTGRASIGMVEDLEVECYGSRMPLRELAAIHAPEPRQIIIQPWDKNIVKDIEKAINQSPIELSPVTDGESIRLNIPSLNEERRKEIVKVLKDKIEEGRISIRHYREEAWKNIQDMEKEGQISEDDKFKAKDQLQKVVDEYNKKIDEMGHHKEQEIINI